MGPSLRLSELYTSMQGEGPLVGIPTQFVRFGGCNMRCPYWGTHTLPGGEVVGACDTPYAVYPQYRNEWTKYDANALFEQLALWPNNICLTGGEPFLQPHSELEAFVLRCKAEGYSVECFTNGTFAFPEWAVDNIAFVIDWKLSGSGEVLDQKQLSNREYNAKKCTSFDDAIKFTVTSIVDLREAVAEYYWLTGDDSVQAEFWVGGVWGKITDEEIVKFVQENKLDWRLNIQTHKHVFDPEARGI